MQFVRTMLWAIMTLTLASVSAIAQSPADFYNGKTIRIVTGGAAGSGYDLYARMLGPWLEKETGARVVVEGRPGAGMMLAVNHTWNSVPDGLTLMLAPGEDAVLANLIRNPGARFEFDKFEIIARVNTAPRILLVNPGVKDEFQQILATGRKLVIAGTGRGDPSTGTASIICHALNMPCSMVIGYPTTKETSQAAINGEVDGTIMLDDSAAHFSAGQQLRAVFVTSRERSRIMPDVPSIFDLAGDRMTPEAAWWIDFRDNVRQLGRMLIAPPGTPSDRVEFLRAAAQRILENPAAQKEFDQRGQPVLFGSPSDMRKLIGSIFDDPVTQQRREAISFVMLDKFK